MALCSYLQLRLKGNKTIYSILSINSAKTSKEHLAAEREAWWMTMNGITEGLPCQIPDPEAHSGHGNPSCLCQYCTKHPFATWEECREEWLFKSLLCPNKVCIIWGRHSLFWVPELLAVVKESVHWEVLPGFCFSLRRLFCQSDWPCLAWTQL